MQSVLQAAKVAAAAPWARLDALVHQDDPGSDWVRLSKPYSYAVNANIASVPPLGSQRRRALAQWPLRCDSQPQLRPAGDGGCGTRSADGRSRSIVGRGLCCREAQVKDVLELLKGEGLDDSPPPGT